MENFVKAENFVTRINRGEVKAAEAEKFATLNKVQQELFATSVERLEATQNFVKANDRLTLADKRRKNIARQTEMGFSFTESIIMESKREWANAYHDDFKPARQRFYDCVIPAFKNEERWDNIVAFSTVLLSKHNAGVLLLNKAEQTQFIDATNGDFGFLPDSLFDDIGDLE